MDGLGLQLGWEGPVGPGELSRQGSNQSGSPAESSSLEVGSVWVLAALSESREREDACYSSVETVSSRLRNGLLGISRVLEGQGWCSLGAGRPEFASPLRTFQGQIPGAGTTSGRLPFGPSWAGGRGAAFLFQ